MEAHKKNVGTGGGWTGDAVMDMLDAKGLSAASWRMDNDGSLAYYTTDKTKWTNLSAKELTAALNVA